MPGLPRELLDIILDLVIDDMRETRESRAVCALMHSSTQLRGKMIRAFDAIEWYDAHQPEVEPASELQPIPLRLMHDIQALPNRHFERDFSTEPRSEALSPWYSEPVVITTRSKMQFAKVTCGVRMKSRRGRYGPHTEVEAFATFAASDSDNKPITAKDLRDVARLAFQEEDLQSVSQPSSYYARALLGSLNPPPAHISVTIELDFTTMPYEIPGHEPEADANGPPTFAGLELGQYQTCLCSDCGFITQGLVSRNECIVSVPLPDYPLGSEQCAHSSVSRTSAWHSREQAPEQS